MSADFFSGYLMGVIGAYFVFRRPPFNVPKFDELERAFNEHWSTVPNLRPEVYEPLTNIAKLAYIKGATFVTQKIGEQIK